MVDGYPGKAGADPEISERGAGSQILEKGGRNSTFQCSFQSFSYKFLTNIPPKGGGGRAPSGPYPKSAPVKEMNFNLNKREFRDAIKLRYDWEITDIPAICTCGDLFTVDHAMVCRHGGLIIQRHN